MLTFKVEVSDEQNNFAKIALEPLEPGYGHTIGNSLRRCLLSSLQGAAITSVKINGVSHQFSTIQGVSEDVIQIILNLKKVRLKIYGEKQVRLSINKSGDGVVTAADIDTHGMAEIVNPELPIATITNSKTKLSMDMTAEVGAGYMPAEEKKNSEIGVMSVDAIFSPVTLVNYSVDQTRVGRSTNFEKLTLEVTTDGTIAPLEAVNKAAAILSGYFKQIYEPSAAGENEMAIAAPSTNSTAKDDLTLLSVEELDLPVRISNALKAIEIDNVGKLITVPKHQLMKAKNLGAKSLGLISEKLTERGLSLSEA